MNAKENSKPPSSTRELVERYNQAWNDHDLEGILALQTRDSEFRIHGQQDLLKWTGIDECRSCYEYLMRAWPDYKMAVTSLVVAKDLYVCHLNLTGTLVMPWKMGGRTYQPIGKPVTFEIVDIIHCEGNLVKLKESWNDGLALHNQLIATGA